MSAKLNREPVVIDRSLVVGNLLFATPRDRCSYIGTSIRDRPLWLEEHAGSWRRIEDVQREAVSPAPPAESEIGIGLALTEPVATASKVSRHTEATMNKADKPKTETTPPVAMRRKPGRSGGRKLKRQKLAAEVSKARRNLSSERMRRMRIVLDSLAECPILSHAARKAGIHSKTLEYWRKRSEAGNDGYDIEWRGEIWRFHEHCEAAMDEAHDEVLLAAHNIAMGMVYKNDEHLLSLGHRGSAAYLRDDDGTPVVETVRNKNPKMLRFVLEWLCPDEFGKHRKINVPRTGGVLIVGATPKKPQSSTATAASLKVRRWKAASKMIRTAKS
jgi:hypothetical protein